MNSLIIYFLVLVNIFSVICYDGYTSCTKSFRGGKSRLDVPCDFSTQTWCTIPGSYYPWRAVRRFVYENHGLMRRMYGEERHISVLRSEIESNDVEYHQTDKWSQQSNLKRYKLRKEEITKSTNKPLPENITNSITSSTSKISTTQATTTPATTTSTTTTTTTTTATTTTTFTTATAFANKSTVYDTPTTTSWADVTGAETTLPSTTLSESDYTTTSTDENNIDITTATDYQTSSTTQKAQPQIFQDTLEKSSSTTEKANLFYKSKGVNACPVKEEVVAPFWANSTRGEVLALLNLYPFEQYVHWERCTFENKQMFCREGCRCEQQYRLHRLLAYDPTNDCRGIFSDWFKFPSCCVCRCYDLPNELRLTSRSPRKDDDESPKSPPT